MEQRWIKGIWFESNLDRITGNASSEIQVTLDRTLTASERQCCLWARIEDRSGNEVDAIFPLPVEEELSFCMSVSDPVLWNAENAYCYRIVLEIRDEQGEVLESAECYTAYYKWEVLSGDNCLNGRKVQFRKRRLPEECQTEEEITYFLQKMKREYCNTLFVDSEQNSAFLKQRCIEYGIYLIAPGEHLECGRIYAELEQNPQGDFYNTNPDFLIQVIKDGALIENRSTFINASEYQLIFEVKEEEQTIQRGRLHVDIPAGESRYVSIPYMDLHKAGQFLYRVSLCLEKGNLWEEEGYTIAVGEKRIANLFL